MAEAAVGIGLSRREFLYYIWGASMALFTLEFTGLFIWFAIPRFKEGEFGGVFTIPAEDLPELNAKPAEFPEGRFWLINVDNQVSAEERPLFLMARDDPDDEQIIKGIVAIYKVCTHLGCIYAWVEANHRFECPCHGSKYRMDGRRIEDPAPRTLDRFQITVVFDNGDEEPSPENPDGYYDPVDPADRTPVEIKVDTGVRKKGIDQTLLSRLTIESI